MTGRAKTPEAEVVEIAEDVDLEHAYNVRTVVFVQGQDCPPEEEFDGLDPECRHLLAKVEGQAAGTARWRVLADGETVKLERFAVLPQFRRRGIAVRLVERALASARASGFGRFVLHAQADKQGLYTKFGFERVGERFVEAGIEHVKMVLDERDQRA